MEKKLVRKSLMTIADLEEAAAFGQGVDKALEAEAQETCKELGELLVENDNGYVALLCEGRHEIPLEYEFSIFQQIDNCTDYDGLKQTVEEKIPADCGRLCVIVTGFTPAMLAVVNVCAERRIELSALHYDRQSQKYLLQQVLA